MDICDRLMGADLSPACWKGGARITLTGQLHGRKAWPQKRGRGGSIVMWARVESDHRSSRYKLDALTTKLLALLVLYPGRHFKLYGRPSKANNFAFGPFRYTRFRHLYSKEK